MEINTAPEVGPGVGAVRLCQVIGTVNAIRNRHRVLTADRHLCRWICGIPCDIERPCAEILARDSF